jgi:hypothetical protein
LTDGVNDNEVGVSVANLGLAPLGNYGGPTQTVALLPGSLAIRRGALFALPTGLTTDQRGNPRTTSGLLDIGAYQSQGFQLAAGPGSDQTATVNTAFTTPLTVTLSANDPNVPLNNLAVAFTVVPSGSSAGLQSASSTVNTGSNGQAQLPAVANTMAGSYTVTARLAGMSASFNLANLAGAPANISALFGSGQSTAVGTPFSTLLEVQASDSYGNLVPGAAVTFTEHNAGGAGATFPSSATTVTPTTNAQGLAIAPVLIANGTPGTYTVTAVAGSSNTVTFTLTNQARVPDHISFSEPAIVTAGVTFPITVTVQDAYNNTVTGYTGMVHFTATTGAQADYTFQPADMGQRTFNIATYRAQTLGVTGTDTTTGVTGSTSFTIVPGPADHLVFLQPPSTTAAGQTMSPVLVAVVDAYGNVETGDNSDTVTLSIGVNPSGGMLSGTYTMTVSGGVATFCDLSINLAGVGYTLRAHVGGGLLDLDSDPFTITM